MLNTFRRRCTALALGLLGLAGTLPVLAHHGFTGEYNAARPLYIEGTVQQVTIAYPHTEMTVQVTDRPTVPAQLPKIDNVGADVAKRITAAAPGTYAVQVSELQKELEGRIAKGDKIALVALQNCLPPNQHRTRWIRLASGDVVSYGGRGQTEVERC